MKHNKWIQRVCVRALIACLLLSGMPAAFATESAGENEAEEFIIPEDEYKVRSMEIDPTTGKVVFRALRYMDSANVLGEVDKNGVVSIISVMHPTYDISVYCALN